MLLLTSLIVFLLLSSPAAVASSSNSCCISKAAHRSFAARPNHLSITDFGGVGDGVTLNTAAFEAAIDHIRYHSAIPGAAKGTLLYIPEGRWLTGCFNVTSHMTIFLERNAVLLASTDPAHWPVIDPLPTFGRGRELPGRRYTSFIHGDGITDFAITGNNGTIDGQGSVWWESFRDKTLKYTRGHLLELMYSNNILLSKVTFANSPFWTIHPVYCSNVVVQDVTILAPHTSPNTDGIDPDSSFDVCIENCYISCGDDAIAVKSGWDEYGLKYNRPSHDIFVRNITVDGSHGISLGSEHSGGIYNIHVQDVVISKASQAIHVKTAAGRGSYIVNATFTNFDVSNCKLGISFTAMYARSLNGDHPDDKFDPNAFATIERIKISNMFGKNVTRAGEFNGASQSPFRNICLYNISIEESSRKGNSPSWNCSYTYGYSSLVYPQICKEMSSLRNDSGCGFAAEFQAPASCKPKTNGARA